LKLKLPNFSSSGRDVSPLALTRALNIKPTRGMMNLWSGK